MARKRSNANLPTFDELIIPTLNALHQHAKDVFMEGKNADTWVLTFALAKKVKIVTHEVFAPDVQKRIPIPNVCRAFSIDYCDTFELLRELKFNF